jgi:hypothetical protein
MNNVDSVPSTDVIRHWCSWHEDNYEKERADQFDAWFQHQLKAERERIIAAIENAPVSLDFFGPYIARDKILAFIKGETE